MIKAEMLNEMNPKLRALLAAGLIGTAGLGAASCSMPTDDPTGYEQPAPENPGDTEETVTFESLGVADYAESLARAKKNSNTFDVIRKSRRWASYEYGNKDTGFILIEDKDFDETGDYYPDNTCIQYKDESTFKLFYVPAGKIANDFNTAIAAYKATYAE